MPILHAAEGLRTAAELTSEGGAHPPKSDATPIRGGALEQNHRRSPGNRHYESGRLMKTAELTHVRDAITQRRVTELRAKPTYGWTPATDKVVPRSNLW
jgi:hypothetical protein